jgi:HEAT repeat protein
MYAMYKRFLALLLGVGGLALLAAAPAPSAEGDNALNDELTVKSAGLPVDGAGLIDFFHARTKAETDPEKLNALVEKLGSKSASDREKACAELVAVGPPSIPYLRKVVKDPDAAEAAGLARRCLHALEADSPSITAAAVRLIAMRKPEGGVQALLDYLPGAEDEVIIDEIKNALTGMAYHDGKADPALLKALEDEAPLRRSTAIDVLCSNGTAEPRATLRKLLADPTPTVRLRAALALAQARDAKAVSTLIVLLGELPVTQGRYAEEYLTNLAADKAPKESLSDDASRDKVKNAWSAWWLATENGDSIIEELTKRTLPEADREKVEDLIKKLGDEDFKTRQDAKVDLKKMGVVVVPFLKAAVNNMDLEISQSAKFVLQEIDKEKPAPLSPVVPRLVALRKPKGGVEAMLAYLPFCEDENLIAEVQSALNALAYDGGKPNAALVKALGDKAARRRGAAAEALCMGPLGDNAAAVKKLLKDADARVQLQAALALAGTRDADAVPVIIDAIGAMPPEQSEQAEEYMRRVAAERPPLDLPAGDDNRGKRKAAWETWWKANSAKVALVDRYPPTGYTRYLGYTLLVQPNNNQIVELGPDMKERWKMTGLLNPQDVQALPGDRFLVAEFGGQRVTERNLKGDVLWSKTVANPLNQGPQEAQRLGNGNTLIVCRNLILEVSRDGKEVYKIDRPNNDVLTAHKVRNGEIVIVSALGTVQRIDQTGKELKSFRTPMQTWTFGNEVLPNGNILIAFAQMNKVSEFDPDGKEVWSSTAVANPMAASRSPSGNTWIVTQQFPNQMVEVDKNNKQIEGHNVQLQNNYTPRVRRR